MKGYAMLKIGASGWIEKDIPPKSDLWTPSLSR